jgi:hypothetical protein
LKKGGIALAIYWKFGIIGHNVVKLKCGEFE